jgi:ribosomal protein L29|tara:strand:- start:3523 stop:3744 length:222 start_codon:yes stop_codon:yes gene_type:complete
MNIEEIRKLETEELVKEKLSVIKNMMEKRFNHKSMQLSDTSQINKLRKDKAKILTVINERKILAKLEITEEDS